MTFVNKMTGKMRIFKLNLNLKKSTLAKFNIEYKTIRYDIIIKACNVELYIPLKLLGDVITAILIINE